MQDNHEHKWTTLKAIFNVLIFFFAPSVSRFSNISAKYCHILTNHTSLESKKNAYVTGIVQMSSMGTQQGHAQEEAIPHFMFLCFNTFSLHIW